MNQFLVAAIFFLSGVSALVYQVVWQRVLTQEIGVDTISVAFIVTIFLMGIAAGSFAGGYLCRRFYPYLKEIYVLLSC